QAGAVVMPASPGFYHRPKTIEDLLAFMTERILDLLGLEAPGARRWKG
ncbi:MAG: 3-octaprenyl-4-hydroxybenzoate carboxy-lyase, partial [Thermus sp.]